MRILSAVPATLVIGALALGAQAQAQSTMQTAPSRSESQTIWQKIEGSWNQTKGAVKEQWGKLTDDDLLAIEGRRDQLVGKIQTRYGVSRDQAEAQVSSWEAKRARQM